jgi:ubiquinone/menaquinone biosynthesis C-methylase UbiE
MDIEIDDYNEQQVAEAFNGQSVIFDEIYSFNSIVSYKRERVRTHLLKWLKPGERVLELNAGTGEDAVFLGKLGHHVHATDISTGMQEKLKRKVAMHGLQELITNELCSFTALDRLSRKGPYDCIFSNFAGLNCTGALEKVLREFDKLLKPGGVVVLVVLPRFCLWESLLFLKGKFKTAGRRFFGSNGRKAKIDGAFFTCWYHSPRFIVRSLKDKFSLLELEGLCTIVPPSYIEGFAEKYPGTYLKLQKAENKLKNKWPWKYIGDYYIISLRKSLS